MHNLYIPVVAILVAFAAIFGGQAISDSQVDDDINALIVEQLGIDHAVELQSMRDVQHGYGVCGRYLDPAAGEATTAFYYSEVNERVALGEHASAYERHCTR
ncbi:hypothetical protein [Salinicola avicenniae]|uniref:hypothetical protein n=1 Tax=Salinicola avicenniae TaxID=2916836 RepID=UPI0020740EEA|nr:MULTISPECIES: hypothetical protein [unclassified Salinicola]